VHIDRIGPFFNRDFVTQLAMNDNARIIEKDIDTTVTFFNLGKQAFHKCSIADITSDYFTRAITFVERILQDSLAATIENYMIPACHQCMSGGFSNTCSCTCYKGDFGHHDFFQKWSLRRGLKRQFHAWRQRQACRHFLHFFLHGRF